MPARSQTTSPLAFGWIWAVAAALASVALVAEYGFASSLLRRPYLRGLLIAALAAFVISRLCLFFPGSEWKGRLARWWMDFLLLAAGGIWWAIDPRRAPIILRMSAIYALGLGLGTLTWASLSALLDRIVTGRQLMWRLAAMLTAFVVVGGFVLALPACWSAPVTGQKIEQYAMHTLNCWFTAASAVTCTGLTPLDIGEDFTFPGQLTILVLLQTGGIVAVVLGTVWVLRWRGLLRGTPAVREEIVQALRWSMGGMVLLELAGTALLYPMWDASRDPIFARTALPVLAGVDLSRAFFSLFHAVSALCNGGLSLTRDGLVVYAWSWPLYAAILPLMILGSIGAPALEELWKRLRDRSRPTMSESTRVTLWGSLALVLAGALVLVVAESTHRWQLRYPRGDTPGRLQTSAELAVTGPASAEPSPQRIAQLDPTRRSVACLFVSAAARTGGLKLVRMDESSLTPTSRWVLMLLMVVGGGVGGTAGGVRIAAAWQAARCVFRPNGGAGLSCARVVAAMLLLIAGTTLVLVYRDVGSFEASMFEAVSACCNVGFTTGLTSQLYVEAKIALILAMILGRSIPLALWSPREPT